MNDTPKITILMPVYNGAEYLREAIDSMLRQTFGDFEFLIINDGSTDQSVEIIESYSDPRIRLVNNGSNLGLISTLNKGVDLAKGEYVARMDCDDISSPTRLEKQLAFMESHPDVGVCGTWANVFTEDSSYILKHPTDHDGIKCFMFINSAIAHPTVMLRRSPFVANDLRYDMAFQHAEDYELWLRASRYVRLANIPEVLLDYRISASQVSSVYRQEQWETAARVREQQLNNLGISPNDEERKVFDSIIKDDFGNSLLYLKAVSSFLAKIHAANKIAKIYIEPSFTLCLEKMWFAACCSAFRAGNCNYASYSKHPILASFVGFNKIRYAIKWFRFRNNPPSIYR